MKQLLIMALAVFVSCNSQQAAEQQGNNTVSENEDKVAIVPLNRGAKWKVDEATKKNVLAMVQVISDSTYADPGERKQLYTTLKAKIDTLVKACSMKGAEHDALHAWLENVLEDLKELKEEGDEYSEAYAALKTDILNFYQSFE
jgi:hypothetical protein